MINTSKLKTLIDEKINYLKLEIEKKIDGNKKTIAFVSYSQNYRNQVGNLHKKFKEAGFNVINIVGFRLDDRFESETATFFIPKYIKIEDEVIPIDIDLEFLDIIIAPDDGFITYYSYNKNFLSKKAKKVYLPHDAIGGTPKDYFHYTILPSKKAIEKYKKQNFKKGHCLIPAGYPKLDYSIEKYQELKSNLDIIEDSILYAPTLRTFVEEFSLLASNCHVGIDLSIIEIINKKFKEKVIFRPHPANIVYNHIDMSHNSSLIIKNKLFKNKKIVLNYEQAYLKYYLRSKCLVTDLSDTAFTYSFTTLKPSIFFDPFEEMPYTEKIGNRVKTLSNLVKILEKILKNTNLFKEKIISFRDSMIENIEQCGEYLIENIDYILKDKKHPDWYYFD